jgi:hypothetical protein
MSAWKADALPLGDARNTTVILPVCRKEVKHIRVRLSGYNLAIRLPQGMELCKLPPEPDASFLKKY